MPDFSYINGAESGLLATSSSSLYDSITESGGGDITIDTAQFRGGARSIKCALPNAASHAYFTKNNIDFSTGESHGNLVFRKSANPTTRTRIFAIQIGGASKYLELWLETNGELRLTLVGNASVTEIGPVVSNGSWVRFSWSLFTFSSTWTAQWKINNVAQTTISPSGETSAGGHNLLLGASTGQDSSNHGLIDVWFDDIVAGYTIADYPFNDLAFKGYTLNGVGTHNLDASPSLHFFKHDNSTRTALTNSETDSQQMVDEILLSTVFASDRLQFEASASTPTLPSLISIGAVASNAGTIVPGLPAPSLPGDVLIIIVETENETAVTLSGGNQSWTQIHAVGGIGTGTGSAVDATRIQAFWARRSSTTPTMPTVSDSGDHQLARCLVFRNCVTTGSPIGQTAAAVEAGNTDTSGSCPAITTQTANELVCHAIATALPDANGTAGFSSPANAALGSVTEQTDDTTAAGTGGGLCMITGSKAVAGNTGNTTYTTAQNTAKAMITFSLLGAYTVTQAGNTRYAEYTIEDSAESVAPQAVSMVAAVGSLGSTTNEIGYKIVDGASAIGVTFSVATNGSLAYRASFYGQNPTGAAWTDANWDSLKFQVGFSTYFGDGVTSDTRLYSIMFEVGFPVSTGPALIPISIPAGLTMTPALNRRLNKPIALNMTMTPTLNRTRFNLMQLSLPLTAVISLVKKKNITVPADLTLTSGITMRLTRLMNMAANLTMVPVIARKSQYFKLLAVNATLTPAVVMRLTRLRDLAATLTLTAVLNRRLNRTVPATATLTPAISLAKFKMVTVPANLVLTGAMTIRAVAQRALSTNLTLTPAMQRKLFRPVSSTVTMTPVIVRKGTYYKLLALTLTLSPNMTTRKTAFHILAATVTHTAQLTMIRILKLQLNANLPLTTALNRRLNRTLNASLNLAGVVQADKLVGIRFISLPATLTMGVTLAKVLSGSKLLSAAVVLDTTLTRLKVAPRLLAASVPLGVGLQRRYTRTLAANLTTNPVITPLKMKFVTIAATITATPVIARLTSRYRTISGNLTLTAIIARVNKKPMSANLTLAPAIKRNYFKTLAVSVLTQPVIDRITSNGVIALDSVLNFTLKIEKAFPKRLEASLNLNPVIGFNQIIMRFRDWLLSATMSEPVLDSAELDEPELISAIYTGEEQ